MDNYKKMMDTEHREEVEALTKEWTNEQKVIILICFCYNYFFYFILIFLFYFIYLQQNAHLETVECKNKEVILF